MKSLYLRIYLTLVALLLAFAFGSAWLFQRQMEEERGGFEAAAVERLTATAVLIHRALPPVEAPREQQAESLRDWGQRLRMAIALNDPQGRRIAVSEQFERREGEPGVRRLDVALEDGRSLTLLRGLRFQRGMAGGPVGPGGPGAGRADVVPARASAPWVSRACARPAIRPGPCGGRSARCARPAAKPW